MFENLAESENRFEQIEIELSRPDVAADNAQFTRLMKEHGSLAPIVEKYREYKAAISAAEGAREILAESGLDSEMKELAQEELQESLDLSEEIASELKIMLLPKDPNDEKNVIVEIRAGTGGEEAALFAASLYRMYSMYAAARGWSVEVTDENETELGGYKEISFIVNGDLAYSRLKYESGTHRVQRVPDTETQGRIHTSAVTVAVLPEADEVDVEINPNDLRIDTYRSSGAGGQHVNKTSSAIRITHIPTGTVVECQDERSQLKNKEKAFRVLRARLYDAKKSAADAAVASARAEQVGSGDRSERIRTYNYPQSRVTDHRIGLTLYRLSDVLNGDLELLVEPLITADRTKALAESEVE